MMRKILDGRSRMIRLAGELKRNWRLENPASNNANDRYKTLPY
jgi:hypothetical protein